MDFKCAVLNLYNQKISQQTKDKQTFKGLSNPISDVPENNNW